MRRLRQQGQRQLPARTLSQMPAMRARRARQRPSRAQPKRSGASLPAVALRELRGSGELEAHGEAAESCAATVGHPFAVGTLRVLCGGALPAQKAAGLSRPQMDVVWCLPHTKMCAARVFLDLHRIRHNDFAFKDAFADVFLTQRARHQNLSCSRAMQRLH